MSTAVVMAGGRSARMRASAGPAHKALVPVLGVSLLERNLCALLAEDFRRIAVAVSAQEPEVERYVLERGRALAAARNVRLDCLKETSPRGTIGAVTALEAGDESVVVVNVDNLAALRLGKLLAFHEAADAAMTIASHVETLQAPCGELRIVDGLVAEYLEKPLKPFAASSGTYVLGPRARALLDPERRWDVPDLVTALIARGERVCAFPHDELWIDVNDAAALARAERLIAEHADAFERWHDAAAEDVVALLVLSPASALLAHRSGRAARYPRSWDVPVIDLRAGGEGTGETAGRLLARIVPGTQPAPRFVTSFDDLDVATRRLARHHVFVADAADEPPPSSGSAARWVSRARLDRLGPLSAPLVRALAWAARPR
jgi:dTDP-glucose pyrophosphorylase